jgi:hypothetical protein
MPLPDTTAKVLVTSGEFLGSHRSSDAWNRLALAAISFRILNNTA